MKYKLIILLTAFILISIILGTKMHSYYTPAKERPIYPTFRSHDGTIRVAFIGDSWAFMHREHDCQIGRYVNKTINKPVSIISYGVCGLTSKEIYENMFINHNFKSVLQNNTFDVCVISAGINDSYKKMGTTYYKQNMDFIIKFMLANNIHPIILNIPDYDIIKAFERQRLSRKALRHLSMFINKMPKDCKQLFRDALDELILEKAYQKEVSIIRYQTWNDNYSLDLEKLYQDDGMHLNERGYSKLDSAIAKEILSSIAKRK